LARGGTGPPQARRSIATADSEGEAPVTSARNPLHCIVPPRILRALAEQKDRRLREIGFRSLITSAHIRGHRAAVGRMALASAAGQKQRTIYDAKNHTTLPGHLVRSEGGPATGDPAVDEAYDGLGATYDLYSEVYHRNSLDNNGMRLDATVHYGQDFDNAFFNGSQMVFGDGDNIVFTRFTKAIDVIGHELTHGVTQFTAGLNYEGQSGALNESFSDVFGSLVKQYHNNQDVESADWLIGAGILAPGVNGVALRSMKEPGTAYDDPKLGGKDPQPATMSEYVQDGDVHTNSGIPNHAFFLLAKQLGGDAWEVAGQIWYRTLLQLWPDAQFQDCANVSAQVAAQLYGSGSSQHQAVKEAWAEVEITVATATGLAPAAKRPRRVTPVEPNGEALKKQLEKMSTEIRKAIELVNV
jgi:Zn-dependent metalloprotease